MITREDVENALLEAGFTLAEVVAFVYPQPLSIRDQYAQAALTGILAANRPNASPVTEAFIYADAALAAR